MAISRQTFMAVYDKAEGMCFYCCWPYCGIGSSFRARVMDGESRGWVIEHMTPVAQGGSDELSKLVLACGPCNQAKGNRTVEQFRKHFLDQVIESLTDARSLDGGLIECLKLEFWGERAK